MKVRAEHSLRRMFLPFSEGRVSFEVRIKSFVGQPHQVGPHPRLWERLDRITTDDAVEQDVESVATVERGEVGQFGAIRHNATLDPSSSTRMTEAGHVARLPHDRHDRDPVLEDLYPANDLRQERAVDGWSVALGRFRVRVALLHPQRLGRQPARRHTPGRRRPARKLSF
jgi:hypothetical protein